MKNNFGHGSSNGPSVSVDIGAAKDVNCDNCGNYTFNEVSLIKYLSEIQSPTGKAGFVPIPVFACNACGFVNNGFLPPSMRKQEESSKTDEVPPKIELVRN
jgi:hypothetical protein